MEPKIEKQAAFSVIGLKYRGKNANNEIPQLWGEFMKREDEVKPRANPGTGHGVMCNYDMETGEFDYLAGFDVLPEAETPEGMVRWDIPEAQYVVFPCSIPTIGDVIEYAYKKWLPDSGYEHTPGHEFEYYPPSFDPQEPDSELFIYIPVKKKE